MAQWGKNDAASNSVLWGPSWVKLAPNTANRDDLFGNTTANAFIDGVTVGQYGVDDAEAAASGGSTTHSGWILRTTGQGGRAGRVFEETLVAGGISGDATDDGEYPDYAIRITQQPSDLEIDIAEDEDATGEFSVVATSVPAGANLVYQWLVDPDGEGFVNAASGTTGNTTATLTVYANSFVSGEVFMATIEINGISVNSNPATLTIVSD
jgi:hypothetical protein